MLTFSTLTFSFSLISLLLSFFPFVFPVTLWRRRKAFEQSHCILFSRVSLLVFGFRMVTVIYSYFIMRWAPPMILCPLGRWWGSEDIVLLRVTLDGAGESRGAGVGPWCWKWTWSDVCKTSVLCCLSSNSHLHLYPPGKRNPFSRKMTHAIIDSIL